MLLVLLLIFIGLIILGAWLDSYTQYEITGGISAGVGIIGGIITVICFCCGVYNCIGTKAYDKKIDLYTEENRIIQEDINLMVGEYMKWESETYEKFKDTDPTIVINLYPDLKSNELIIKQMDIYIQNKEKINKLKCKLLDAEVWAWWVYFG